jgi:uncharacterized membrane protein YhaH (DUF805 family)
MRQKWRSQIKISLRLGLLWLTLNLALITQVFFTKYIYICMQIAQPTICFRDWHDSHVSTGWTLATVTACTTFCKISSVNKIRAFPSTALTEWYLLKARLSQFFFIIQMLGPVMDRRWYNRKPTQMLTKAVRKSHGKTSVTLPLQSNLAVPDRNPTPTV